MPDLPAPRPSTASSAPVTPDRARSSTHSRSAPPRAASSRTPAPQDVTGPPVSAVVPRPSRKRTRAMSEPSVPHGSYHAYYARRADPEPRVDLLFRRTAPPSRWLFDGDVAATSTAADATASRRQPRVLDVGCNDGTLSRAVARRTPAVSVVGVDIDSTLVRRARIALRAAMRAALGDGGDDVAMGKATEYPYNLSFRTADFAGAPGAVCVDCEKGTYDMVLMFSVTKWVHLYGGDGALRAFFARAHTCLREGGVLVLEPQPMRSYGRAKHKEGKRRALTRDKATGDKKQGRMVRLMELKLVPEKFAEYLLSEEGGFESMEMLREFRAKGEPFNRQVMAFYKGGPAKLGEPGRLEGGG